MCGSREFVDATRLAEPHRDLLIDAGCTVDVHDPRVLEYPGVDIPHDPSDAVSLSST